MLRRTANLSEEDKKKEESAFNNSKGVSMAIKTQSVLALLNYYTVEELEIMDGPDYRSHIQNSLRKYEPWPLMAELISDPAIGCSPEIVQFYFNDPFTFLRMIKPESYAAYIENLVDLLNEHMDRLRQLLGATDFDMVDINPKLNLDVQFTKLAHDKYEDLDLIQTAPYKTKLWWTINKISMLIELLTHAEFLPRSS